MLYCLKLVSIVLVTLLLSLLIVLLGPFERSGNLAYAIGRLWTWAILKIGGIHVTVRGLDRLDPSRPYVFIANHQSLLDIPVVVRSLPSFQIRWIAKKQLAYVPFFGWALWASRHILVDRIDRANAMASFRKAKQKIAEGMSVVIFPEGTRGPGGERVLPFKRGGFLLALQTQTPIVPVSIRGSSTILPKGDWRINSGEIEVTVEEPIAVEQGDGKNVDALVDRVREIIESNCRPAGQNSARARAPLAVGVLELG
jgi:1-acyl-sn-glycerol-3-phosphate acyltransferase